MRWKFSTRLALLATICAPPILSKSTAQETVRSTETVPETIPTDFQGRASYGGIYSARQKNPAPRRANRISFGGGQVQEAGGGVTVRLTFKGGVVTGDYSGDVPLQAMTLTGTRQGNRCRLYTAPRPAIFEGECSPTRFVGRFTSQAGEPAPFTVDIEASATQFVSNAFAAPRPTPSIGTAPLTEFESFQKIRNTPQYDKDVACAAARLAHTFQLDDENKYKESSDARAFFAYTKVHELYNPKKIDMLTATIDRDVDDLIQEIDDPTPVYINTVCK